MLRWSYGLRNTGPRALVVVRASLGPLVSDREVEVPAGEDVRLLLRLALRCDSPPALGPARALVELTVRTAGGGERTVQLPGDLGRDDLARAGDRACGYPDVGEAVAQDLGTAAVGPRRLVVPVTYTNTGRRPASLLRVVGGSGMQVRVQDSSGRSQRLPSPLPPASDMRTGPPLPLLLEVTVTDCGALVVLGAPGTGQDVPTALSATVADLSDPGPQGQRVLQGDLPNTAVRELLADVCRPAG